MDAARGSSGFLQPIRMSVYRWKLCIKITNTELQTLKIQVPRCRISRIGIYLTASCYLSVLHAHSCSTLHAKNPLQKRHSPAMSWIITIITIRTHWAATTGRRSGPASSPLQLPACWISLPIPTLGIYASKMRLQHTQDRQIISVVDWERQNMTNFENAPCGTCGTLLTTAR